MVRWFRGDYVLIPMGWFEPCSRASTDKDALPAIGKREDHRTTGLVLEL